MRNSPLELQSERTGVTLRELYTSSDDLAYFQAVEASRADLKQSDSEVSTKYQTLEDVTQARLNAGKKIRMGIWDGETFVGTVNANIDDTGCAEIGYWTDSRYTGRGYATLGAKTLSAYVAQYCPKVYAEVAEGNEPSMAVLRHAGFQRAANRGGYVIFERIGGENTI